MLIICRQKSRQHRQCKDILLTRPAIGVDRRLIFLMIPGLILLIRLQQNKKIKSYQTSLCNFTVGLNMHEMKYNVTLF